MKVLYIPKFKKDKAPFYISKIVNAIVSNIDNSIILLSPGYLSVSNKSLKNLVQRRILCDLGA